AHNPSDLSVVRRTGEIEQHWLERQRQATIDKLRGYGFAVVRFEHAGGDLAIEVTLQAADPHRGPGAIELCAELRHAVGYGDHRAQGSDAALSAAHEVHKCLAEARQHPLHIALIAVEGEDLLGLSFALLLDDGLE